MEYSTQKNAKKKKSVSMHFDTIKSQRGKHALQAPISYLSSAVIQRCPKKGGKTSTKPNQVHHFATNKSSKYTSQFENIAKKYNLDLDDAWNKELMPHQGRHPDAYHDYVLDNMQKFDKIAQGDVSKFLRLYDQMKQKIINNPDMLCKDYWKTK